MSKLALIKTKIIAGNQLTEVVENWKSEAQRVVFTNGVFDLLHRGHIEYLSQAADFGDKFIVAINADESVKKLGKGKNRPLQDEKSRALIIAALEFVDAVVIFNKDTPLELISAINPDVLIKGGDYDSTVDDNSSSKYIVGSDVVKNKGGIVEVIQFVEGYSTSIIEKRIKED